MQKKKSLKIISIVMIFVLISISITYSKNDSKVVLATTKEFNLENLEDNEYMHVEIDNSGDKVPVPNGYVGSKATGENEIDIGYVIYEGTEEVNNDNVEEAQRTRNQYVWIPVPDSSTMYGTDENGKKWGKLYEFTTDTGDNIDPVTGAKPLNWSESDGVMKILDKNNEREPCVSSVFFGTLHEMDSELKKWQISEKSTHKFLIQLEKEFNNMIESTEKYGGFYIGRYEIGDLSKNEVVIKKENTDLSNQTWYSKYKKCKELNNGNMNVQTGMIWGCQWDRTLIWLIESGNKSKKDICADSTTWGNYNNVTFEYINNNGNKVTKISGENIKIPTGSSEYTKANNIYDLAGNVTESTMQSREDRVYRGGFSNAPNWPADFRGRDQPTGIDFNVRLPCNAIYKIKSKNIANNLKK